MSASKNSGKNLLSDDDIWDDALLIKAYDSSINLAKEELAKRIATSTNTTTNKVIISDDNGSSSEKPAGEMGTFKIGDYVRATYDDEIDYEAKIIAIDKKNDTYTIKYIGYENEQNVALANLVPSWGKKSRRMQFSKGRQGQELDKDGHGKKSKLKHSNLLYNQLPPPPPMPPMLNELNEDSENISAMLMSWYMSGYYTGLYQGQKLAKSKLKNKSK